MTKKKFTIGRLRLGYYFLILVCVLAIYMASGCARTVTSIVPYGEEITVSITLRGAVNVENNRYFLVLSDNPDFKVPLPRPDIIEATPEFVEPGLTPIIGSEEAYNATFFSTWSSYFVLDNTGYNLVHGPFVVGVTPTREVVASLDEETAIISFTCQLARAFSTVPDQIYFDLVTVPWPDGLEKTPADHLPSTDNYFSRVQGSIEQVTDTADSGLDPSLDILNIRIEVL